MADRSHKRLRRPSPDYDESDAPDHGRDKGHSNAPRYVADPPPRLQLASPAAVRRGSQRKTPTQPTLHPTKSYVAGLLPAQPRPPTTLRSTPSAPRTTPPSSCPTESLPPLASALDPTPSAALCILPISLPPSPPEPLPSPPSLPPPSPPSCRACDLASI